MLEYVILIIAAFSAGVLNTIAGGGSFLTFPALVYVGVNPIVANATSAVAVFPGYLTGALGFKEELRLIKRRVFFKCCAIAFVGGLFGALLLIVTSDKVFNQLVPWLLLFATLLFAVSDKLLELAKRAGKDISPNQSIGILLVSVYGGYFNGGLGIVFLAIFALSGLSNINLMNGLKNSYSFVISAISVLTFIVAGLVKWPEGLVMMIAASIGGYVGAMIAKSLSKRTVQYFIVFIGIIMSVIFFSRI